MDQSSRTLQKISTSKRAVFNINQGHRSVSNNPTSFNDTLDRAIPSANIFVNCNFILDTDLRRLNPSPIAPNNEFEPSQLRPSPVNSDPRTNVIKRSSITSNSSSPNEPTIRRNEFEPSQLKPSPVNSIPRTTAITRASINPTRSSSTETPNDRNEFQTDLIRTKKSSITSNESTEYHTLLSTDLRTCGNNRKLFTPIQRSSSTQPSDRIDQQYGTSSGRMNRERVQDLKNINKDTYIRHRSSSTTKDNNQELPLRYNNVRGGPFAPTNNQTINSEYYVVLSPANNACFANVIIQSFLSFGKKISQFIIEDEKSAIKTQLSVFFYAQALKSKEAYKTQALRESVDRQLGQLGIDSSYSKNELYDAGKFFEHIMAVSSPKLSSMFALSVSLIIHLIIFLNNYRIFLIN